MKIIFFFCVIITLNAQNKIDSIQNLLRNESGIEKVKLQNQMSVLLKESDPEKAMEIAKQALNEAQKYKYTKEEWQALHNISEIYLNFGKPDDALRIGLKALRHALDNEDPDKIGDSYYYLGLLLLSENELEKAYENLSEALKVYESLNNKIGEGNCYTQIAIVHYMMGKFEKALEAAVESLKIREQAGEKKYITDPLNILAVINFELERFDKAAFYNNKALQISKEISYQSGIFNAYMLSGSIYYKQKKYSEALENYYKVIELSEGNDMQQTANAYGNIANVMYDLKKYQEALNYYLKIFPILEKAGDKYSIANNYKNIGGTNIRIGRLVNAELNLNKALEIAEEINARDLIKNTYDFFVELYEEKKDYKSAIKYLRLFTDLKDSTFNYENSKLIEEIQEKYEGEKKEKEIALLKKEKEIQINWFISSGFFVLLLSSGIFARMRFKRILGIEKLRAGIAADLHDDIGSGLVKISMLSDVLNKQNVKTNFDEQLTEGNKKIADISRELITTMSDVVWAVDPKNDSLEKLINRLEIYCREICETAKIEFEFTSEAGTARIKPGVNILKAILMISKEAFTNIIKHSKCSKVEFKILLKNNNLEFFIEDNGEGFIIENLPRINGLNNMKKRVQELNGSFEISSDNSKGTKIKFSFPVK